MHKMNLAPLLIATIVASTLVLSGQARTHPSEKQSTGLLQLAQNSPAREQVQCPGGSEWDVVLKECGCSAGTYWEVAYQRYIGSNTTFNLPDDSEPRGSFEHFGPGDRRGSF